MLFAESHFGSTVILELDYIFYQLTAGVYPHNNYCTSEGAKLVLLTTSDRVGERGGACEEISSAAWAPALGPFRK